MSPRRHVLGMLGAAGAIGATVACSRSALPGTPPTKRAPAPANPEVILATTTSTQDSGLLDLLLPRFEAETGYRVKTVAVGSGAALALGARGEADVVLVHAPEAEVQWMAEGYGLARRLVMHNDFMLLGPPADPAGIRAERVVVAALRRIAAARVPWISRDDSSGTDQLEKRLWKLVEIDPRGQPWYITSGQGIGATLTLADQKDAYTVSDRATFLARRRALQLAILLEGDPELLNVYHVMAVNPAKVPGAPINVAGGEGFAAFLVTPQTQRVIAEFGKDQYSQPLFFADAGQPEPSTSQ